MLIRALDRARSGDVIAPEGQDWAQAYEQSMRNAQHPGMLEAAE